MDPDASVETNDHPDRIVRPIVPDGGLPPEVRLKVWTDPEVTLSLLAERPTEAARKISDFKRIDTFSRDVVDRGALGEYSRHLSRLGAMAERMHELLFPEDGSWLNMEDPLNIYPRVLAGRELIAFQSDARQMKLSQDILGIVEPAARIDAIHALVMGPDVGRMDPHVKKLLFDAVFDECVNHDKRGDWYPASVIGVLWEELDLEHKSRAGGMTIQHPDLLHDILASRHRLMLDREWEAKRPATSDQRDTRDLKTRIDVASKKLDEDVFGRGRPTQDRMLDMQDYGAYIRELQQDAHREAIDRVRSRERQTR